MVRGFPISNIGLCIPLSFLLPFRYSHGKGLSKGIHEYLTTFAVGADLIDFNTGARSSACREAGQAWRGGKHGLTYPDTAITTAFDYLGSRGSLRRPIEAVDMVSVNECEIGVLSFN
jgi:hypothetical protein